MKSKSYLSILAKISLTVVAVTIGGMLQAAPETRKDAAVSQPTGKEFNTPKAAADALIEAAESYDTAAVKEILGPGSDDIVSSEDAVADKNRAMAFVAKAKERTEVGADPKNKNRAILTIGNDQLPVPIPIVKNKGKWSFDTKVGREEILNRRIGANELDAIAVCRGYVEAQHEYADEKHDDAKVNQYAQRIISTPGKHDGLAWQNPDGTWGGPVGEGIARAIERGYTRKERAVSRLLFQSAKRAGPVGPNGADGLCRGGRDDRRLRPRGCARAISGYRSEELHRRPGRCCLREGSRARHAQAIPGHGSV